MVILKIALVIDFVILASAIIFSSIIIIKALFGVVDDIFEDIEN